MDAIKTEVERLGGRVAIESKLGDGTRLTLEFPLSHGAGPVALTA
jgi:chemotaxis protein histidine kinase CheA